MWIEGRYQRGRAWHKHCGEGSSTASQRLNLRKPLSSFCGTQEQGQVFTSGSSADLDASSRAASAATAQTSPSGVLSLQLSSPPPSYNLLEFLGLCQKLLDYSYSTCWQSEHTHHHQKVRAAGTGQ